MSESQAMAHFSIMSRLSKIYDFVRIWCLAKSLQFGISCVLADEKKVINVICGFSCFITTFSIIRSESTHAFRQMTILTYSWSLRPIVTFKMRAR